MSRRKEYDISFLLNAQLNGGFGNTFSKAQQEFARLGKEIQSLNRVQSDISSYQKQQTAMMNTEAKLQNLKQQHDLLQREIGETSDSTAALEREKLKLEQRISTAATALENQKQKLEATGNRLREAGVDTGKLAQKEAELTEQIKQLSAEQEKAADSAQEYSKGASSAFEAVSAAITSAGIADALKEIAEAYSECISSAGDFEASMSNVKALSGATSAEMEQLSEKAKQLGADTEFSAKESAQAMGYMSMAGWNASQMLAGMDGVMSLASASGEDLARVSDIVTDSMTAFGLTAADTARYADVLAAAATKSNTNVSIMGETFKFAAPVAGTLGYSVEDVSVAIGLMANAGIKGSIAGTALKNTFNGLLEGATLTSSAFGEYEYSAVKADGTMRSFSETIAELRVYFDQMTKAEKVANAEAIAGMYGYSGLLAILNATNEDYAALTESINNCTGAAKRMAAIKMDNLNGDLELMNGSWEALKTTIGEQFIPEMRTLYSVGADVFDAMNDFVQANPGVVKGIMASVGAIGAGVAVLTGVATVTNVLIPLMTTLAAATPGVNAIMGVTAAVAGIVGVVTALSTAYDGAIPSVRQLTEATRDMEKTMEDASAAFEESASSTMAAARVADAYISKLEELEAAGIDTEEETRQYQNTLALLLQVMPSLADCIGQTTDEYGRVTYTLNTSTEALRLNTEAWRQNAMQQAYQEHLTDLMASYSDVLIEAEKNSIGLTKAQYDLQAAEQKQADTISRMDQLWAEAEAEAKKMQKEYGVWADATGYLSQEYYDLQNSLTDISDEMWRAQVSIENYEEAIENGAAAVAAAEKEIALAEEAVWNLNNATTENSAVTEEAARQQAEISGAVEAVMSRVNALAEAYEDAYNAAYESISGQYKLWDEAADVVATSAYDINTALESQVSYWQDYNANLASLSERSKDIAGLSEVISTFADGSAESVNAIAGLAHASDEDLTAMVNNWKALQEEQALVIGSVAELKTNFAKEMDELQTELADDIAAMDLSREAVASGQATIQSYIDGAIDMLPQVEAAYAELAEAARNALHPSGGRAEWHQPDIDIPGYATGTRSAAPGLALVGENGPELVCFDGGERVLTAPETSALMRGERIAAMETISASDSSLQQLLLFATGTVSASHGFTAAVSSRGHDVVSAQIGSRVFETGGTPAPVVINFNIEGSATPETVEQLRAFGDEIVETVLQTIEDRESDKVRLSYW